MKIRDLESLILKKFEPGSEVVEISTEEFLLPHEIIQSNVLRVCATVKELGRQKLVKLNLMVKFLDDDDFQKIRATVCRTFETELFFYEKIAPNYDQLIKNYFPNKKPIYPEFFGSRLSLNENAKFRDNDVAILLQDLTFDNYQMVKTKKEGLESPKIFSVLDSLAMFHSLGFIAKEVSPNFQQLIQFLATPKDSPDFAVEVYRNQFYQVFSKLPKFEKYRHKIAEILVNKLVIDFTPGDSWNTVIHNDTWTNNVMFGADDHAILLDYQLMKFASPLKDLLNFLVSSVELDFGHSQMEEAMEFYREKLNFYVKGIKLEFSKENFENRLKIDAQEEFMKFIVVQYFVTRPDDVEREDERSLYFKRVEKWLDFFVWKKWLE